MMGQLSQSLFDSKKLSKKRINEIDAQEKLFSFRKK